MDEHDVAKAIIDARERVDCHAAASILPIGHHDQDCFYLGVSFVDFDVVDKDVEGVGPKVALDAFNQSGYLVALGPEEPLKWSSCGLDLRRDPHRRIDHHVAAKI